MIPSVESRVIALEKSARRSRILNVVLLSVIAVVCFGGFGDTGTYDMVFAKSFVVIDDNDHIVGTLGSTQGGGKLELKKPSSTKRGGDLDIDVSFEDPFFTVKCEKGNPVMLIYDEPSGTAVIAAPGNSGKEPPLMVAKLNGRSYKKLWKAP